MIDWPQLANAGVGWVELGQLLTDEAVVILNEGNPESVKLTTLKTHPDNPRRGDVDAVAESMRRNGFWGALIVQKSSRYVLAGNHRLLAARKLEMDTIPVIWVDVDDTAARRILLADNRTSDLATYDDEMLAGLLADLAEEDGTLEGTGYSSKDLDRLLHELDLKARAEAGGQGEDDAPDVADEWVEKFKPEPGKVWQVGRHRLMCASSADPDAVARLFDEEVADQMITDPPYGVDYGSKDEFMMLFGRGASVKRHIANDAIEDYRTFFALFMGAARLAEKNTVFIFMSGLNAHNLRLAFDDADYRFSDWLVWVKNRLVLGRMDYHPKHELIAYGWRGAHEFFGDRTRTSVLEFDRPSKSELHPTMKPVELIEQLILDGSLPDRLVYDPFGGSGTTMVAAHRTGRRCCMMELEPVYCATILERMERLGVTAEEV